MARPDRVGRLRARLEAEGVDGYFGVRRENTRYLTGFELCDGEEKVAGVSGQFLVGADETVVLADSRYRVQAQEQCPESRIEDVYVRVRDALAGAGGEPAARSGAANACGGSRSRRGS